MSAKSPTGTYSLPGPLPKWERVLAWAVWLSHSAAAFVIAVHVSHDYAKPWIRHWLEPSDYAFMGDWKIDLSDAEWSYYRRTALQLVLTYAVHSFGVFSSHRILTTSRAEIAIIFIGFITQLHMTSLSCMLVLYSFAMVVTLLSAVFRNSLIPWMLCILFVTRAALYVPFSVGGHVFYREFNVYLYGAIKVLNFCLFLCKNPSQSYRQVFVENMLYYAYLPYTMTLIVLFEDFRGQFLRRQQKEILHPEIDFRECKPVIKFAARLFFWFFFFEFILHFVHVNSLFNSPFTVINGLNTYQVCAVSYVVGQLFFVKYVVIFGIPSLFAYVDGMTPPPPPICISRVSLYSRMWRHFDAGLYQFLKHQVYVPIMKPQLPPFLSVLRSFGALAAVFSVVIAWHGAKRHYIFWVSLSAFELVVERIGWLIWKQTFCQKLRKHIGEHAMRRTIATLMLACVTPGIFGVFFFLGQEGVGETVFQNVIINGVSDLLSLNLTFTPLSTGFCFLHILTLGYFYNNVCLDLEIKNPVNKIKIQ